MSYHAVQVTATEWGPILLAGLKSNPIDKKCQNYVYVKWEHCSTT